MRKLENNELERKSIEDFKTSEKNSNILVLDDIRSLQYGSVFNSRCFLMKDCCVALLLLHLIKKFKQNNLCTL
jgi:hypothetical protein